jgi:hypothetical protein
MADKKYEAAFKAAKRLVSLGAGDDEILNSLREIGFSESEAAELHAKAKEKVGEEQAAEPEKAGEKPAGGREELKPAEKPEAAAKEAVRARPAAREALDFGKKEEGKPAEKPEGGKPAERPEAVPEKKGAAKRLIAGLFAGKAKKKGREKELLAAAKKAEKEGFMAGLPAAKEAAAGKKPEEKPEAGEARKEKPEAAAKDVAGAKPPAWEALDFGKKEEGKPAERPEEGKPAEKPEGGKPAERPEEKPLKGLKEKPAGVKGMLARIGLMKKGKEEKHKLPEKGFFESGKEFWEAGRKEVKPVVEEEEWREFGLPAKAEEVLPAQPPARPEEKPAKKPELHAAPEEKAAAGLPSELFRVMEEKKPAEALPERPEEEKEVKRKMKEPSGGRPLKASYLEKLVEESGKGPVKAAAVIPEGKKVKKKFSMIIVPDKQYLASLLSLLKDVSRKYEKICYIALNTPSDETVKNLQANSIDGRKFFFVDAVTKTIQRTVQLTDNHIYVSSPSSLIELSLAISEALRRYNPDLVILDSLSTMLVYEKEKIVTKFVHSLIGKIKQSNSDFLITALEGDSRSEAVKDISMFMTEVLTFSEYSMNSLITVSGGRPAFGAYPEQMKELPEKRAPAPSTVKQEMSELKKRLEGLEGKPAILKGMESLEKRLGRLESRPIEKAEGEEIREEIRKFAAKLGRGSKAREEISGNLRKELSSLYRAIDKTGSRQMPAVVEKEMARISGRIEKIAEKSQKRAAEKLLKKLTSEISRAVRKQPSKAEIKKIVEKAMPKERRAIPRSKLGRLEKKLDSIEKKLTRQQKDMKKKASTSQRKHQALVETLEKKLVLLRKSYDLGIVTKESYLKDKAKIEAYLRK